MYVNVKLYCVNYLESNHGILIVFLIGIEYVRTPLWKFIAKFCGGGGEFDVILEY